MESSEPSPGRGAQILVAFRPPAAGFGGDHLFFGERQHYFGDSSHWLEPTKILAQRGLAHGIAFHTDDVVRLTDASVFVFGEVPTSRREIRRLRQQHAHLKIVLHILESPLGRDWIFDPRNHSDFDAVVSYNPALYDGVRYHTFKLPAGGLNSHPSPEGALWENRKIACMVAQVPNVRPFLPRRSGLRMIRTGWRFTPRTWWNYVTEGGSLYGERLRIARVCEEVLGDQFDIFGAGWPKANGVASERTGFSCARGVHEGSKLELLQDYRFIIAYENCLNDCGYISEKLFDALLTGCVPVYLGNKSIGKYLPEEAFVDARKFRTRRDLAIHLKTMSQERWLTVRRAGSAFLCDTAAALFGSEQYAASMIKAVQRVMSA